LIKVTPSNQLIELDINQTSTFKFVATGRYLDGVDEDLSDQVTWTQTNTAVGYFAGGSNYNVASHAAAGSWMTRVTAELGGRYGQTQFTVVAYR